MGLDKTRQATQEIADMADQVLIKAADSNIDPNTFTICAMLKFIVAQLGIIAITIAEKK